MCYPSESINSFSRCSIITWEIPSHKKGVGDKIERGRLAKRIMTYSINFKDVLYLKALNSVHKIVEHFNYLRDLVCYLMCCSNPKRHLAVQQNHSDYPV